MSILWGGEVIFKVRGRRALNEALFLLSYVDKSMMFLVYDVHGKNGSASEVISICRSCTLFMS